MARKRRLHGLPEQKGASAHEDDVLQAVRRFDPLLHARHGLLRHALGQRQQPLEVVGLLEYHRGLAGPQRHVDGVQIAEGRADVLGDLGGEQLQHVCDTPIHGVALLLHQSHALGDEPVEGSRTRIDDQAALLGDLAQLAVGVRVEGQRALRLGNGQRTHHTDLLAAADIVLARHDPLQGRLLHREQRHRKPDDQQVDLALPHRAQRTAQQRHVLRRLDVVVVQLRRPEGVGREPDLGTDFIEE